MRSSLGLTIEEFALLMGVSATTVKNWEAGISEPSRENALRMVEVAVDVAFCKNGGKSTDDVIYLKGLSEISKAILRAIEALLRRAALQK